MVEQPLPLLVSVRAAETFGVVFERLPAHEKDILRRGLDATLELVGEVARRGGYDRRGLREGPLELGHSGWEDVQLGDFQDHGGSVPWREL